MEQEENNEIKIVITINRGSESTSKNMEISGGISIIEAIGYLHLCIKELSEECLIDKEIGYKEPPLIASDIMLRRLKLSLSIAHVSRDTGVPFRKISHLEKGFASEPEYLKILDTYYKVKEQQRSKQNG